MSKYAEPGQAILAKDLTKKTGLYPGDLLMMAARGNLYPKVVDGDDEYTTWQPRIDPVTFQGARAPLSANQTIVASTALYAVWGLPNFQTTAFWDAGDPTKLTIPQGITKVVVTFQMIASFATAATGGPIIEKNTGTFLGQENPNSVTTLSGQCCTGPIDVIAGDFFRGRVFCNKGGTLLKNDRTWITLQVLEAT